MCGVTAFNDSLLKLPFSTFFSQKIRKDSIIEYLAHRIERLYSIDYESVKNTTEQKNTINACGELVSVLADDADYVF